jgi:hypothetical protein
MMHHGMPLQHLLSNHMRRTSMGAAKALSCRNIMEASETREHGSDSRQNHQVEEPIIQAKEWMREFGRCNPWSTRSQKSQSKDECTGRKPIQGGDEATQAGRPRPVGLPLFKHPQCSPSAGKSLI